MYTRDIQLWYNYNRKLKEVYPMKKVIALLFTLILVSTPLLFGSNAFAQGTDSLEYTENSSGITITSIEIPENGILKIPEKIDGKTVTDISGRAILKRTEIVEVHLPDGLTEISAACFSDCINLKKIVFGKKLKDIKHYAFTGCTYLESVSLPSSVENIEIGAFANCSSLKTVEIPSVKSIGSSAFEGCAALKEFSVKAVSEIGAECFMDCTALESITLPKGISKIGERAFSGCAALKKVSLPEGLSELGYSAFSGCTAMEKITLPDSLTVISPGLFSGCTSLKEINIGKAVEEVDITAVDGTAFKDDRKNYTDGVLYLENFIVGSDLPLPEKVRIKDGVTYIPGGVFSNHYGTTSLILPVSVKVIVINAFSGWQGLKEVSFGKGITEIGVGAFENTRFYSESPREDGLLYVDNCLIAASEEIAGDITVKEGTRVIADFVFSNNNKIKSVTLPESLVGIGYGAFRGCKSIHSVTLPAGLKTVGAYAFSNCFYLDTVTVLGMNTEFDENWCRYLYDLDSDDDPYKVELIRGSKGSKVEKLAEDTGIKFEAIGLPEQPPLEEEEEEDAGSADPTQSGGFIWILSGAGLVLVAAVIVILLKKKSKKDE